MAAALERVSDRLPAMVIDTLREQWARVAQIDEEIRNIEHRLRLWHRGNAASRRIADIPGVGVLSATAAVAAMGDPAAFRSGTGVCRLARPCTQTQRYRRTGTHARHLQARGPLPAPPSDPRCPVGVYQQQGATRMGVAPRREAAGRTWPPWRWPTRRRARSGLCWPMIGRTKRTSSVSRPRSVRRRTLLDTLKHHR